MEQTTQLQQEQPQAQEAVIIHSAEALQAMTRADLDVSIVTAKQYPRHLPTVLNKILTYATMDSETAEECFYVLRRGGSTIEGLSVRMAEIIAGAWGNMRVQSHIIGNDGKTVTAQAACHDLETNLAVMTEVSRRITDKYGRTYSEDMQTVTKNAACSIAFRNAVLKVVPKAVTKRIIAEVKKVAMGQALDLETSRQNIIEYFAKLGATEEMVLHYLGIKKREEIDKEMVYELRGLANAIKEGTSTTEEAIIKPFRDAKAAEAAEKKSATAAEKAQAAMNKAGKQTETEPTEGK